MSRPIEEEESETGLLLVETADNTSLYDVPLPEL